MAESAPEQRQSDAARGELKHLGFFRLAALRAVVWLSTLYGYAKENSGSLKPGIQAVEGTVKTIVSPVYERFSSLPYDLLKFVDRKVDESMSELERFIPPVMKAASAQAYTAAQKAPGVARSVVDEVQRTGVVGTAACLARSVAAKCEPVAKQMYTRYEPVAEQHAVAAWRALDGLPLFHQVAQIAIPTAAHWAERYNRAVRYGVGKGYAVAAYMPLVPTDRIAKVFGSAGVNISPAAEAQ